MAQTAIKSPTDVVDFLVSQHQQIKALFAETLAASGKARERKRLSGACSTRSKAAPT